MTPRRSRPEPVTAVIDSAGIWLPARMEEVEAGLKEAAGMAGGLATDAGEILAAGGKRMRPMLVLLCAGPAAGPAAVRAGVAVELVHMASLIHDDVLDRAPLRRGVPTVYATAGRHRATSLGDRLFATAFDILVYGGDEDAIRELSMTAVDLARGELLQRRGAWNMALSEEEYFRRCHLKTGRLFEVSCLLGRASTEPVDADRIGLFGHRIGLAFQMLDDVLDISGSPERTGKSRGTDLLDGTVTLPVILAARVDPVLRDLDLHRLDRDLVEEVCDRIEATGALERVRARAIGQVEDAKAGLHGIGIDTVQRELLELIADGVVSRYS